MGTFIITTASHTDTGKQVCRHRPRWAHFWVDWENLGGEVTLRTYPKPFRRAFDFDFCNQHHHLRHALTRVVTVFRFVSVAAKFGGSPPHPHPISLAACKRSSPNYIPTKQNACTSPSSLHRPDSVSLSQTRKARGTRKAETLLVSKTSLWWIAQQW